MEINKGIRAKLFILFVIMGSIPFIILIGMSARSTLDDLEEYAKQSGSLKNTIISEHISDLIAKNQVVLQAASLSPEVVQYLQEPTPQRREVVEKIMNDLNNIFGDTSTMALTGADAWQLIRTDGATLVNLSKRQHFKEAMKGRVFVSDIISSMSTGKMIIVVEAPVFNAEGKPIGMIQRNFNLDSLEEYIKILDEDESYIILMDRRGHVITNSKNISNTKNLYNTDASYKFIMDMVYNSSGSIDLEVNGELSIVSYSRNINTGWMIVNIRPYHHIMNKIQEKAIKALIFGLTMLFLGTLAAYLLAMRITKPIIEMTNAVNDIASGKKTIDKVEVATNDELGRMAAAFNKIRHDRDTYQLESELDKLTELYNKKTMENLCKMKLKTFNENETANIYIALYVIDLDHFKEVNDLLGHQFGDKVLVEFAKDLRKVFRPNDCIGRFGGDEFVVILDSLPNMEVVTRKAEQIKQIAYNLTIDGNSHFVTASIGIAVAPQNGRDYDTLFAVADKAVYHVKNNGKNGYYCELFEEDKE